MMQSVDMLCYFIQIHVLNMFNVHNTHDFNNMTAKANPLSLYFMGAV